MHAVVGCDELHVSHRTEQVSLTTPCLLCSRREVRGWLSAICPFPCAEGHPAIGGTEAISIPRREERRASSGRKALAISDRGPSHVVDRHRRVQVVQVSTKSHRTAQQTYVSTRPVAGRSSRQGAMAQVDEVMRWDLTRLCSFVQLDNHPFHIARYRFRFNSPLAPPRPSSDAHSTFLLRWRMRTHWSSEPAASRPMRP